MRHIKSGMKLNDLSESIHFYVLKNGFDVLRHFTGHGVGIKLHEEPNIPNFSITGTTIKNIELKAGMILAIEPMVVEGEWDVEILDDKWTVVTKDKKLSSHFEHTVLIKKNGTDILTFR